MTPTKNNNRKQKVHEKKEFRFIISLSTYSTRKMGILRKWKSERRKMADTRKYPAKYDELMRPQ